MATPAAGGVAVGVTRRNEDLGRRAYLQRFGHHRRSTQPHPSLGGHDIDVLVVDSPPATSPPATTPPLAGLGGAQYVPDLAGVAGLLPRSGMLSRPVHTSTFLRPPLF
jgi:hypothetical protein